MTVSRAVFLNIAFARARLQHTIDDVQDSISSGYIFHDDPGSVHGVLVVGLQVKSQNALVKRQTTQTRAEE